MSGYLSIPWKVQWKALGRALESVSAVFKKFFFDKCERGNSNWILLSVKYQLMKVFTCINADFILGQEVPCCFSGEVTYLPTRYHPNSFCRSSAKEQQTRTHFLIILVGWRRLSEWAANSSFFHCDLHLGGKSFQVSK